MQECRFEFGTSYENDLRIHFQIIGNSLIESCAGVRLACLDCEITVSCAVKAILYLLILACFFR